MKLIRAALNRPMSAILIIAAIVMFGISSITGLKLEYFPSLEMPMQLVFVTYPGADADSVERLVTEPIEDIGNSLTGMQSISSTSYDNYATIQFTYDYDTDLDDAYMELKEALDNLEAELPENCQKPTIMEISLDSDATIALVAQSTDGSDILDYVNDTVVPELEQVNGVAQVEVSGSQEKYVRIVLNEAAMKQYGLSISTVAADIADVDFDFPLGDVNVGNQEISLSAYTEVDWHQDLRDVPVKTGTDQLIRLEDIATFINLYTSETDSISRYNGDSSVIIDVTKKSSAPTIATCSLVEEVMQGLVNESMEFSVVSSTADDIQDTLKEVLNSLIIGVILTILVLFLCFGDIRASLIVGSSMPLSIFLALSALNMAGINFDLMTGTGMIIAIGMIVDNAIVILENCFRVKEQELDFKETAIKGAGEMLLSVAAGTLTTVVVYAPICLTSGMSSQMNIPLCLTIIFTMLASLLSAVFVVPLLFMLVKPREKKELPINKVLNYLGKGYCRIIPKLLHHLKLVLLSAVLLLVGSIGLAAKLNFDLFPNNFDGSIEVTATFRSGTRLEIMDEHVQELEEVLLADEGFSNITLTVTGNTAEFRAYSQTGSKRSSEVAAEYYQKEFNNKTYMDITVTPFGVSSGLAALMSTGNNIEITIEGEDLDRLRAASELVSEQIASIPGIIKVTNEFSDSRTKGQLHINRRKALDAGLTQASVAMQVYHLLNGITAAEIEINDEEYDVILEYPEGKYQNLQALMDYPIIGSDQKTVMLSDIAEIQYTTTMQSITREDGQFITSIIATSTSEDKYSSQSRIDTLFDNLELPEGTRRAQNAMDTQVAEEMGGMGTAMVTAVFLVFLVMAIQFESIRLSVMVMTCIPFSLIGSFGMLFLSGSPLSMMAMMGFLMLIGMVVNNGILLVDTVNQLKQTMPLEDALVQAGMLRLRPILMTTLTTVLSMVPMLISGNSGMAMMQGMAYVILGGLCASTTLAMFLMPSFYLLVSGEKINKK